MSLDWGRIDIDPIALTGALSDRDLRFVLHGLDPTRKREFDERWEQWAHPGQRPDDGDWRVWMIMAGRGFGKTRAGAEWISALARADGTLRLALIGATFDDVRKVMIEGESGLFSVACRNQGSDMSDPWLEGPVTSVAYGWRLERSDGVTLGFTSHDRDVLIDGVVLRASPGMVPSSIVESIGFETDGLEVSGALSSSQINSDDLATGRWDAARLQIFLFDWSDPAAGTRNLAVGELGTVSYSSDAFETELLGLTQLLDRPVVPQTSPGCRAMFCDSRCKLNRLRFRKIATVASVDGDDATLTSAIVADAYAYGEARWLDGPNTGLAYKIVANGQHSITFERAPYYSVAAGSSIELIEGCDKRLETCATRFDNAVNFRGEPYLPGNDLLTRYPGGA